MPTVVLPKKVNELDPLPDFENTKLLVVADPVTGKSYKATMAQLKGLSREKIIFNNDGSYTLPAGTLLIKLIVILTGNFLLNIGNSAGTHEILEDYKIVDQDVIAIDIFALTPRNIYFSGITGNGPVTIIFIKSIE